MNVIAWVLVSATHNGFWVPSLEFNSEKSCQRAILSIEAGVGKKGTIANGIQAKCIKIER